MKLSEIETPALLLDLPKMEENMKKLNSYLTGHKVALRPHFKTNKSLEIVK